MTASLPGGGGAGGLGDLLKGGLGGLLAGGAAGSVLSGGLGDLLNQFQQKGHGDAANSWVSNGPNKQIAPGDLASALGADQIDSLSSQSGLSRDELLQGPQPVSARRDQSFDAGRTAAERTRIVRPALTLRQRGVCCAALHYLETFERATAMSGIIWIIIVGFIAGIIARLLSPGPNNPSGFILTTVLGIAGAFLATFIGQAIGHYGPDQGAGFITATIGALVVLFIWNRLVASRVISDPGTNNGRGRHPGRASVTMGKGASWRRSPRVHFAD